jgi:hypothetical protein
VTRDELVEAGERLFGPAWTAPLAAALGLPRHTVRRWAEGRSPVSAAMAREVNRLLAAAGHHPVGSPSLAHLTMNTGNLVHSPRDQVLPSTIEWLAPLVAAGKGEPAGIPFEVTQRGEGTALFVIGRPAAVACGVCWREDRAPAAWDAMLAVLDIQGAPMAPAERPPVPWLAVAFMPGMGALLPETLVRLGDMERCLAWVLVEQATGR